MEAQERRRRRRRSNRRNGRKENTEPEQVTSRQDYTVPLEPTSAQAGVRNSALCRQNRPLSLKPTCAWAEARSCDQHVRVKRTVPRSAITGVLCVSIHRDQALVHVHIQEAQRLTGEQRTLGLTREQRPLRQMAHKQGGSRGCYVQVWLTSDPTNPSRTRSIRSSRPSCDQRFTLCVGGNPHVRSRLVLSLIRSGCNSVIGCMSFGLTSLLSKPVNGCFYFLRPQFGLRKHLRSSTLQRQRAAEHTVPFCVNPASSSEPGGQSEPGLVCNDGRAAPKEQGHGSFTSTRSNANISSSANVTSSANVSSSAKPGRADSGHLQMVISRGPDGFGFTIFSDCPVRVQDVDSGGPAHTAGLRHGDAVLQLNGVSVETWGCGQLAHAIRCCPAHISLVVWRPAPETTPTSWPRPPHQQSETTKGQQSGAENRRRGQRSLWRRSQDTGVEPNHPGREEPALSRPVLSGFGGEDYILLSPMEHSLSVGRATTIGRWYHPPPTTRPTYSSATLPPPLAKTLGCYGDYENCTIVQSHICDDFGSIAPKTLIFPIHLKPIDLCSPDRTLLMSEDLILHQPDLLPAKVTVMVYNDLLLFTKEDEIGRYNILQSPVYLDTVSFIEVSSKPLHLFFLRTARGSVQFSLEAYTLQQKHRLSICLHDNMHHLVSMETQRLSLHDNSPTAPESKQLRDRPSKLLAPGPPSSLCSPVWKPRSTEHQGPGEDTAPDAVDPNPVFSEPEDTYEEHLRHAPDSPSGLSRALSEGSLLQEPRSPHFLSHSPVLTWPLRTSLDPESSSLPRPSALTLKKHLTEGGSLHRALELLYGTKALEAGHARLKKRNKTLVSLAFLQRRKNNGNFNSNSLEKALRNNRPATEQVQRWSESLEALLTNQYGLAVFRHFLRSEFSEENLDFWLAVEKFKRTCPQKMVSKATRIYNEFISCNATQQVNIDSAIRELTNQSLSLSISPSSFQLAQDQIYNLMLTDSYPRFLKSRLYSQLANQNQLQGHKLQ